MDVTLVFALGFHNFDFSQNFSSMVLVLKYILDKLDGIVFAILKMGNFADFAIRSFSKQVF